MYPPSMRSVFGVSSPGASAPQQDYIGDYINRVLPALRNNRALEMNDELANKIRTMQASQTGGNPLKALPFNDPTSEAPANKPMNVVAGMSPYEQARIALAQQAEKGKNERAGESESGKTTRTEESIAGRKDIAGQAEQGRTGRAVLRSTTQLQMSDDKLKQRMKEFGLKEDQFDIYKKIHNMTDSERMDAIQNGRISMENLRHVYAMELTDEKGDIGSRQIKERGQQQRTTQASKPMTSQQQAQKYENSARQIKSENPSWNDCLQFNPDTNKFMGITMPKGGDQNIYHEIGRRIYGGDQPSEVLPNDQSKIDDKTSKIPGQSDDLMDNSPAQVTQYQKGDDPLGLFGESA